MGKIKQSSAKGAFLSLVGFGLYSTHDVVVKYLGGFYTPFQIMFFSVLFSFPLVTLYILRNPRTGSLWPHHPVQMSIRVLATSLSGFCTFYAFSVLPLAQTYALLFLTPILITVLSIPVLGERVGLHRGLSVLVGFIGVLVVLQPGDVSFTLGHLAGLGGVVGAATNSLITRRIGQREKMAVMLLYPMLGNFLIMGSVLPFVYEPMPLLHLGSIAILALLGFLAMFFIVSAFQNANAAIIAPMQYSQILWAGFFGLILFSDQVTISLVAGSALIIASGLYIVKRELSQKQSLQPVLSEAIFRPDNGLRPRFAISHSFFKKFKRGKKDKRIE
ncbi:DMT family transporter [Candidatus Puniceispirillum marinum]|uniref:Integral membrane protein, putative n=1 Tax=Puniceispirillum marinum (strain IMCC1322) TaxID=488538 RepID=D5BR08_PUNMI|nr:DMT family transporter [Candidatus Puniceispirillum marinum]ADE38722.1 integral membrane protein, putative [Candidatus Puniceispirillum marinum IMCC1322]